MYQKHFNLVDMPFSMSPDPRYMLLTPQHREAIGRCQYIMQQKGGLVVVYGDIGMGKTTIARKLFESVRGMDGYKVGMLITPALKTETAFLRGIMTEYGVPLKRSYELLLRAFQDFIIESFKQEERLVLIIDEAQKLTPRMLDVIHTLLNFESNTEKFLQIILLGQNELAANIDANPAIKSRVAMFGALNNLTREDTERLIDYRWKQAGGDALPFSQDSLNAVYEYSRGLPREINKLCNESVMQAFMAKEHKVTKDMVEKAALDLRLSPLNIKHVVESK